MTEPPGYRALTAVLRLQRMASSIVDAELKSRFRLRLLDYQVLKLLQIGDSDTQLLGALARQLGVHTTTVSIAADRLDDLGLTRRHVHPQDRRATLVSLTDRGRARADEATDALSGVGFGLPGLSSAQLKTLLSVLENVRIIDG
jgi:DNA-binding MarR family transcriptional regulator